MSENVKPYLILALKVLVLISLVFAGHYHILKYDSRSKFQVGDCVGWVGHYEFEPDETSINRVKGVGKKDYLLVVIDPYSHDKNSGSFEIEEAKSTVNNIMEKFNDSVCKAAGI